MSAERQKQLIEFIVRGLVERPEEVVVQKAGPGEQGEVLELRVAPEDRGKVIGKNGRTAHAIRTLLAASSREGHRTALEIID